jgi:hypothetical protein
MPAKPNLRLVVPNTENRAVGPTRRPNGSYRTREYLTEREVEQLLDAAKQNRHGQRDPAMILIAYRHGFRASEICGAGAGGLFGGGLTPSSFQIGSLARLSSALFSRNASSDMTLLIVPRLLTQASPLMR